LPLHAKLVIHLMTESFKRI